MFWIISIDELWTAKIGEVLYSIHGCVIDSNIRWNIPIVECWLVQYIRFDWEDGKPKVGQVR